MLMNWRKKLVLSVLAFSFASTIVQPVLGLTFSLNSTARAAWCWGLLSGGLAWYAHRAAHSNTNQTAEALFAAAAALSCLGFCWTELVENKLI